MTKAFTCVKCGREITEGMLCKDCSSLREAPREELDFVAPRNETGKLILCLSLILVVCAAIAFGVIRSKAPANSALADAMAKHAKSKVTQQQTAPAVQAQTPAPAPVDNWDPDPHGILTTPPPQATLGGSGVESTPQNQPTSPPPYVAPNVCTFCEGKGQIDSECEVCNGSGEAECQTCTTNRRYTPRGGISDNFESAHQRCRTCQGTSHPETDVSGRTHYIFHCLKCNGTGHSKGTCPICKGTGKDH